MRDGMRLVPAVAEALGEAGELARRLLGERLTSLLRPERLRFDEGLLEPIA